MTPVSRLKLEEILIKIHETISKYQIKFTVFGSQMNIKLLKIQKAESREDFNQEFYPR